MAYSYQYSEDITTKVLAAVEAGNAPWQQTLAQGEMRQPINAYTGKGFYGQAQLILEMSEGDDRRWMQLDDANAEGLNIKANSKSVRIEKFQFTEKKEVVDPETGEVTQKEVPLERVRTHYNDYYNAADVEGIEPFDQSKTDQPEATDLDDFTQIYEELYRSFDRLTPDLSPENQVRQELAHYMIASRYGAGFKPSEGVDFAAVFKQHDRAFFQMAADANEIVRHALASPEQKPGIAKSYTDRLALREQSQTEQKKAKEEAMANRQYIKVNYKDKDEARAMGAYFHGDDVKSWYIPEKLEQAKKDALLAKFEEGRIERKPSMSPEQAFGDFLRENGAKLKGDPVMDSTEQRVAVDGEKKGKTSGMYTGYADGFANGRFTNFKQSSQPIKWAHTGQEISPEDRKVMAEQAKKNDARREAAKLAEQKKAGRTAFGLFSNNNQVRLDHPYIQAKGITDPDVLRGVKVKDQDLFVPVRNEKGSITSVQFIKENGDKYFLRGGAMKGGMHIVGDEHASKDIRDGKRDQILIAEGYATAASLYEATGKPAVVAFNGGNLQPVAETIRKMNPKAEIIIAADNDHKLEKNVGLDKAHEAASAVRGQVIVPFFTTDEKNQDMTDWNDLAVSRGDISKTVTAAINKVLPSRSRQDQGMEMA